MQGLLGPLACPLSVQGQRTLPPEAHREPSGDTVTVLM